MGCGSANMAREQCRELENAVEELKDRVATLEKLLGGKLPCDVVVAPNTIIRKGCKTATLLSAIGRR